MVFRMYSNQTMAGIQLECHGSGAYGSMAVKVVTVTTVAALLHFRTILTICIQSAGSFVKHSVYSWLSWFVGLQH